MRQLTYQEYLDSHKQSINKYKKKYISTKLLLNNSMTYVKMKYTSSFYCYNYTYINGIIYLKDKEVKVEKFYLSDIFEFIFKKKKFVENKIYVLGKGRHRKFIQDEYDFLNYNKNKVEIKQNQKVENIKKLNL